MQHWELWKTAVHYLEVHALQSNFQEVDPGSPPYLLEAVQQWTSHSSSVSSQERFKD